MTRSAQAWLAVVWLAACAPPPPGSDGGTAGEGGSSAGSGGAGGTAGSGGTTGTGGSAGSGGAAGSGGSTPGTLGATCSAGGQCQSGFCVDGVCCDTACTGACMTCGAMNAQGRAGSCLPVAADVDPDDECAADAAQCRSGTCNGQGACGAAANGTVCRAAAGACDTAESCQAGACPADTLKPAETLCRASAGACDTAEACNGTSAQCPADAFVVAGASCREGVGACDVEEVCTGTSPQCPSDGFLDAGVTCRAAAGVCDAPEVCTGASKLCPGDAFADAGVVCRGAAAVCDAVEVCTGASASCPTDARVDAGTVCRGSAGVCDVADSCDGVDINCPTDRFASAPVRCGMFNQFVCSGTGVACPSTCSGNSACAADAGFTCRSSRCIDGKWVFTTSSTQTGALGGLVGADGVCQRLAADAGLTGNFLAWLGTDAGSPATRFTRSTVPWYLPNGLKVANGWADLTDGTILVTVQVTERGVGVPSNQPWTNVNAVGGTTTSLSQSCDNWTNGMSTSAGRYGTSNIPSGIWSTDNADSCSVLRRLYCFEQ